jgi:hypothetical protein
MESFGGLHYERHFRIVAEWMTIITSNQNRSIPSGRGARIGNRLPTSQQSDLTDRATGVMCCSDAFNAEMSCSP